MCQDGGTVIHYSFSVEYIGTRRVFAAGDLVDFVACEHLARLRAAVAAGEREAPPITDEDELIARKGEAHEAAHLAELVRRGVAVVEIGKARSFEERRDAARATAQAMRAGADAIHGAVFVDLPALGDGWAGVADFAIRTAGASDFGDYHYEIWDAKLARTAKPSAIVQMCVYSALLARVQGVMPARLHAILGDGTVETYRVDDALPYVRAARARFIQRMGTERTTYPEPVENCARCRFLATVCEPRRRADDHLSLVANARRSQIVKLHAAGIDTVAALAAAPDGLRPRRLEAATYDRLRTQAREQVAARTGGVPRYELLPLAAGCGFERLPEPDAGDLYFDIEGDPFYGDDGLEYLFGVASLDANGDRRFESYVGEDRVRERGAFEAFIDNVMERRRTRPNLHIYHYASYEISAVRRLASRHATREREVDELLRGGVFVDLFDVVRQSLIASFESYSLKKIEQFYRGVRAESVTSAIGSVVMYERYIETRDPEQFDQIVRYNREDCYSTLDLHRWLLDRRAEAAAYFETAIPWRSETATVPVAETDTSSELAAALLAAVADPPVTDHDREQTLVAHMLAYHRREAKPSWWAYFERREIASLEELVDHPEAVGDLRAADGAPELFKRSASIRLRFPPQEHKLKPGRVCELGDKDRRGGVTLVSIDDARGELVITRATARDAEPLPRALGPDGPVKTTTQAQALARFAEAWLADRCATRYRACADLVRGEAPRLRDRPRGARIDDGSTTPESLAHLIAALDDSYLFVQGPPGAGKTYVGARAIVLLMERGVRVGIASTSHKAIHHLLGEIERVAAASGVQFRGYKKSSKQNAESRYTSVTGAVENVTDNAGCAQDRDALLVAGTAWLYASADMDGAVDVLVIDEAGQVALADAIVMTTAAKNVVLLGDPMQLGQVSQGSHPDGADASVLKHLLGDASTVAEDRGLFLPRTYRMHEHICRFISALAYDGRLAADPSCALRRIDATDARGAGLRYLPVPHEGNVQSSAEEADAIVSAAGALLSGGFVTDETGSSRPLDESDILVVTPYNAQVRRIRTALDTAGHKRVRVGTVDKFQGQEAPVVFFSMAASRGDEIPRGIAFLFDRQRLNVAVSRAQVIAVLVCAPTLLEITPVSLPQLAAVNALCRFVDEAVPYAGPADAFPEQLTLLA